MMGFDRLNCYLVKSTSRGSFAGILFTFSGIHQVNITLRVFGPINLFNTQKDFAIILISSDNIYTSS